MIRFGTISSVAAAISILISGEVDANESQNFVPLSEDWCLRDAPGFFRSGKSSEQGACPETEKVGDTLPKKLVLPLPCDRAMVLRRIDIPVKGVLDQIATDFGGTPGSDDLRVYYSQQMRSDTISGAFSIDEESNLIRESYGRIAARSYYMGAYELTELQWNLYESGALEAFAEAEVPTADVIETVCSENRALAARTPPPRVKTKIGLGYYDAIDFIRALNAYALAENTRRIALNKQLIDEGGDSISLVLPWERGSPGFFRLPSESEWEFAARGGAISEEATLGQTYLIRENDQIRMAEISDITNSSNDVFSGTEMPNLAGLYDVVGNADEITLDLFRLIRPDGTHGSRGGFVLRGGNIATPGAIAGVARRSELALYDSSGEFRPKYGGLRVALVAPVFPDGWSDDRPYQPNLRNVELDDALLSANENLTSSKDTPGAEFRDRARDLISELKRVEASSESAKERLQEVEEALRASEAQINEARKAEIGAMVTSAVAGIQNIRLNGRLVYYLMDTERTARAELTTCVVGDGTEEIREKRIKQLDRLANQIAQVERQIEYQTRYALGLISALAEQRAQIVDDSVARNRASFERDGLDVFSKAWDLFGLALEETRGRPSVDLTSEFQLQFDDAGRSRAQLKKRGLKKIDCGG
jgi:hypothetical protein